MVKHRKLIVIALIAVILTGCSNGKKAPVVVVEKKKAEFGGNYVSADYHQRHEGYDWVAILVRKTDDSTYHLAARSRIDRKRPTCTFDATARVKDSTSLIAQVDGKVILFTIRDSILQIAPEKAEDTAMLNYYCSGGATLAGSYRQISEPLDSSQLDPRIFTKFLSLQNISFEIDTKANGSQQTLSVQPFGLSIDNQKFVVNLSGSVEDAEIEDLNSDGYPEVLIYTRSRGNENHANIIGYSVNKGKSLSQIGFPDLADNSQASHGYRGHDSFRIVENSLVQRFRIYQPSDTDEHPTGNYRQVQYKLKDGEACRNFVIDKIVEFPAETKKTR